MAIVDYYIIQVEDFFHYQEIISKVAMMKKPTLPTAETLSGKNARASLVCGFLMKLYKENILKI